MTSFLLDTCVLSESSKPRPHPSVAQFFWEAENLIIPVAALMELQMGIMKVCETSPLKAVKLSSWYQKLVSGKIPIAQTDRHVCEVWGTLAADPRLRHLVIPRPETKKVRAGQDLHIAATALVHRTAIATFNVKDFLLINSYYPLPGIYDPMSETWHAKIEPLYLDTPEPAPVPL
jgi:toxin FitB